MTSEDKPVFDFTSVEDVASADIRIKDPTDGTPTSMLVTLAGPEHPDRRRRLFQRQRRLRAHFVKSGGKLPATDPEDDDADEVSELVACTLGWTGASTPFSPEAARAAYTDPKRRWFREQVKTALDDREAFTRRSAAG